MASPKLNDFKRQIYACNCKRCQAVVWLVEDCGATLRFIPTKTGRLCELAVVAAASSDGISERDVVRERRAYARHLGIKLSGPTSDADEPAHIHWALEHSNHNAGAQNPVKIGRAKATFSAGRYYLR